MSPECVQQSRSRSGSCSHCSARSSCGSVAGAGAGAVHRVVMLGGPGVGKSAICSQLLTSDHVNTYEPSMVEDAVEKEVGL